MEAASYTSSIPWFWYWIYSFLDYITSVDSLLLVVVEAECIVSGDPPASHLLQSVGTVEMKTNEMPDNVLNWAVAKACNFLVVTTYPGNRNKIWIKTQYSFETEVLWNPVALWAQGGPIVDHLVHDGFTIDKGIKGAKVYKAVSDGICIGFGSTVLTAAMRAYVTYTLGYDIEVPEELQ